MAIILLFELATGPPRLDKLCVSLRSVAWKFHQYAPPVHRQFLDATDASRFERAKKDTSRCSGTCSHSTVRMLGKRNFGPVLIHPEGIYVGAYLYASVHVGTRVLKSRIRGFTCQRICTASPSASTVLPR